MDNFGLRKVALENYVYPRLTDVNSNEHQGVNLTETSLNWEV